jgi:hypothetical protein
MFRRIVAVGVCVGVIGGSAGIAEAAVEPGKYRGMSAQDAIVSLRVQPDAKSVVKYAFQRATLDCSDNQPIDAARATTPSSARFPISTRGAFAFTAVGSTEALEIAVKGKVNSPRASGTLRIKAKLNDQRQLDPNGSITCDSGRIKWSATKL